MRHFLFIIILALSAQTFAMDETQILKTEYGDLDLYKVCREVRGGEEPSNMPYLLDDLSKQVEAFSEGLHSPYGKMAFSLFMMELMGTTFAYKADNNTAWGRAYTAAEWLFANEIKNSIREGIRHSILQSKSFQKHFLKLLKPNYYKTGYFEQMESAIQECDLEHKTVQIRFRVEEWLKLKFVSEHLNELYNEVFPSAMCGNWLNIGFIREKRILWSQFYPYYEHLDKDAKKYFSSWMHYVLDPTFDLECNF